MSLKPCLKDTVRILNTLLCLSVAGGLSLAQEIPLAWRPIGTTVVAQARAGYSGEPIAGLWLSPDENTLQVQLHDGRIYQRSLAEVDDSSWSLAPERMKAFLPPIGAVPNTWPEAGAKVQGHPADPYVQFAMGQDLWISEDQGRHWRKLGSDAQTKLIGSHPVHLQAGLLHPGLLVAATAEGIWISRDSGISWTSLNEGLPNLHLEKIIAAPSGGRGLLAMWRDGMIVEWVPGSRDAWMARGRANEWRKDVSWSDPERPGLRIEKRADGLWRTLDGGVSWDNLLANLAGQDIRAVVADRNAQAVYVASEKGVYYAAFDLEARALSPNWLRLGGAIAARPALDVYLDDAANFLYASYEGEGVFLTLAPHRRRNPRVVSAAHLGPSAAAPGSLLTIVGAKLKSVRAGGRNWAVLPSEGEETQVQVPFDVPAVETALEFDGAAPGQQLRVPMARTAPVIFTDREGAALLVNGENGELLDPLVALRAGAKVQILMTGLGAVEPSWPLATPAPAQNPPRVLAPVRVWLSGQTLTVLRSELASGYVGFYLVEVQLPVVLDSGVQTLAVEADGKMSNTILLRVSP